MLRDEDVQSRHENAQIWRVLRFRFSFDQKAPRFLLALTALMALLLSSSELWISSGEACVFAKIPESIGIIIPSIITFFLILFHCMDWKRISEEIRIIDILLYGIVMSFGSLILMFIAVLIGYVCIGEFLFLDFSQYWKLFYLAAPLTSGEFILSSMISRLLSRTSDIEKKLDEREKRLKRLLERTRGKDASC